MRNIVLCYTQKTEKGFKKIKNCELKIANYVIGGDAKNVSTSYEWHIIVRALKWRNPNIR